MQRVKESFSLLDGPINAVLILNDGSEVTVKQEMFDQSILFVVVNSKMAFINDLVNPAF